MVSMKRTTQGHKIKFIRNAGYHPYCIIGDTVFSIHEHGIKGYFDNDYYSGRPLFAVVSRPLHNPLRTWGFSNMGDAVRFMGGICPGYIYLFSSGNRSMYRNDEWEVIFATHHNVFKYIDVEQMRQCRRRRYMGDEADALTECYYEVSRRRALRIIKEGLHDLKDAMDFAVEYLTRMQDSRERELQPTLFD